LVKGLRPGDSDVEKTHAGILQVQYRWKFAGALGASEIALLQKVGLTGTAQPTCRKRDIVLRSMCTTRGVYLFRNSWHAVAADTRGTNPVFYDIANGCFSYDSTDEFKQGVQSRYPDSIYGGDTWFAINVRLP
jgi:hypothetical protein